MEDFLKGLGFIAIMVMAIIIILGFSITIFEHYEFVNAKSLTEGKEFKVYDHMIYVCNPTKETVEYIKAREDLDRLIEGVK